MLMVVRGHAEISRAYDLHGWSLESYKRASESEKSGWWFLQKLGL